MRPKVIPDARIIPFTRVACKSRWGGCKSAKGLLLSNPDRCGAILDKELRHNFGKIDRLPQDILQAATNRIWGHVYGVKQLQPRTADTMRQVLSRLTCGSASFHVKCRSIINQEIVAGLLRRR